MGFRNKPMEFYIAGCTRWSALVKTRGQSALFFKTRCLGQVEGMIRPTGLGNSYEELR